MLRPYQQNAIDIAEAWMSQNERHPCIVMPTGAGKSYICAELSRRAVMTDERVLMLTHVKELIAQNANKLLKIWPDAPLGIYSAGLKQKRIRQITYAGIQSVRNSVASFGHIDRIIIDECHLISHKDEGVYRGVIEELQFNNPRVRIIGLTATPWRLGHGVIAGDGQLFAELIEPTSIMELIDDGYLSPLRSKAQQIRLSVDGVRRRGGEFIEGELQRAVDTTKNMRAVLPTIMHHLQTRKACLIFCSGVSHSYHVADALRRRGIVAETVTGESDNRDRDRLIEAFKAGKIQVLTNANVLTTGFDYPDIDLIVMLRPTMSPVLYMQMIGRGMRPKSHIDHCLVLDFAGNIQRHGPVTHVTPPKKGGSGDGEAPVKICPACYEICHLSVKICPACKMVFPVAEKPTPKLSDVDIMDGSTTRQVSSWFWSVHLSRAGKECLKGIYRHGRYETVEYLQWYDVRKVMIAAGLTVRKLPDLGICALLLNKTNPPKTIRTVRDGKFQRIKKREWGNVRDEDSKNPDQDVLSLRANR